MIVEKSAGAIVFKRENSKIKYLLLQYESMKEKGKPSHWEFPRGSVEEREDETKAAKREVREETGLKDLEFIPGFREQEKIFFRKQGELVLKIIILYLALLKKGKVAVSWEHLGFEWLEYKEALDRLTYKTSKKLLTKANEFLTKGEFQKQLI